MTAMVNRACSRRFVRLALPPVALVATVLALLLPGLGSAGTSREGEPTISGGTSVGDTLTGSPGTWAPNAVSYKYNWRRCPPDGGQGGGNCDGIVDGPDNAYVLQPGDVGFTIRLQVKAWTGPNYTGTKICIDNGQTCAVASNATSVITGTGVGPTNTGLPTITGTAAVGQTLTASQGSWENTYLVDFSYGWLRCDAAGNNCQPIGGAVGTTYVVVGDDMGSTLRAQVTATDPAGTTKVSSPQTTVVPGAPPKASPPPPSAPPPPTGAGCPPGRGAVQVSSVTPPARLIVDRQSASPKAVPRASGQDVVVRYHVSDTCGQSVQGALVYATAVPFGQLSTAGEVATGPTGYASLTLHTLAGFPLSARQRGVAVFVRARKLGENLLTGISTRRLFAIPVGR